MGLICPLKIAADADLPCRRDLDEESLDEDGSCVQSGARGLGHTGNEEAPPETLGGVTS